MERRRLRPEISRANSTVARNSQVSGSGLALVADDRYWIERIRGGNATAFEALFRAYVRPLTAFAYRYVQSYDAAIAVVTEVFTRLWRGRHSWAFHGSVRGNLFASAHRVSLESLHRSRNDARWHAGLPGAEDVGASTDARATESATCSDLEAAIRAAVTRLPARARTVGFMRWSDRLTRNEIATVLGVNARTVHTMLTPASRAMRRRFGAATDGPDLRPESTLRDAADPADRFTMIDPDRVEFLLAGECIPAEVAALRVEIADAGGEPSVLDAMEAVWSAPRRAVESIVNEESAWRAVARRVSMPHEPTPAEGPRQAPVLARAKAALHESRVASKLAPHAVAEAARPIVAVARHKLGGWSESAAAAARRVPPAVQRTAARLDTTVRLRLAAFWFNGVVPVARATGARAADGARAALYTVQTEPAVRRTIAIVAISLAALIAVGSLATHWFGRARPTAATIQAVTTKPSTNTPGKSAAVPSRPSATHSTHRRRRHRTPPTTP